MALRAIDVECPRCGQSAGEECIGRVAVRGLSHAPRQHLAFHRERGPEPNDVVLGYQFKYRVNGSDHGQVHLRVSGKRATTLTVPTVDLDWDTVVGAWRRKAA